MAKRKKGGIHMIAVISDSEEIVDKINYLLAEEMDEDEYVIDWNYDGSSESKTIKINNK